MARVTFTFNLKDGMTEKLNKIQKSLDKVKGQANKTAKAIDIFKKKTEKLNKMGAKLRDVGKGMTVGLTLPIVAAGGAMVKLASDMEETINKVDVSFGSSSQTVKDWAKNSITSMGLAQQSALDSAALYGDMATGMGLSQKKASEMAMSLTQLGADLASFKNISNDMAQTALKSIFTGETESLKNLGVVMTEANLKQFAMSKGIRKNIKDMTEQEKIQLRYNYVMEKTKNAHGDFARTGGSASNQMRMFQENMKELGVTFGQYILPYFTKAVKKLNEILVKFNELSPWAKKAILIIGVIGAVIGPTITVIGGLIAAINGIGIALTFLAANPFVLFLMGVAAATWTVIKAIEWLIEKLTILKGMKLSGDSFNLENEDSLRYWSDERKKMGAKEFNKRYDRKIQKAVNNYDKRVTNNTTNNTTTTNNNYYAGNNPRIAPLTAK